FRSYIFAQYPGIGAVTPWMWYALVKNTDRGIAGKHVKRVLHNTFYVFFSHPVKYTAGAAVYYNIENRFRLCFSRMLTTDHPVNFFYAFPVISAVTPVAGHHGVAEMLQFSLF